MPVKTYADNPDYQDLVASFEKTKDEYESAKKQRKIGTTLSTVSKEEGASKAAIALSYFEYKQSKLQVQSGHLAKKTEKLKQKSDKLAVKIAKLKLKVCAKSLQKTEGKQSDTSKKTNNSKKQILQDNQMDNSDEPQPKNQSKTVKNKHVDKIAKTK